MCQSHIFSGWNFEKNQKSKTLRQIPSKTFILHHFEKQILTWWKFAKKKTLSWTLASYGVNEMKAISHLWHCWISSSFLAICESFIELLDFQDIIQPPSNFMATMWQQPHMHDFTYSCSCFAQKFECSATEPQKNQYLCSAARSWICTRCHFETMPIIY
jgi:hypothetical protein